MEVSSDWNLEVDVNGEETFIIDKRILASFSGRFRKLFSKSRSGKKNLKLKVIFQDFPGGPGGFELITRFCYSNGKIKITPSNVILLSHASHFMQMDFQGSEKLDLITNQIEEHLLQINSWTWTELLSALKQIQDIILHGSYSLILVEKTLGCLIQRISLVGVATSSCTSFSENSSIRFSCDTSITSPRSTYWWFEDLLFFNVDLVEKIIKMMIFRNFDHDTIGKFLFYYQKSRLILSASQTQKRELTEMVIDLLSLLDRRSLSWKGIFSISQAAWRLKLCNKYNSKLEILLGSNLDQANIDYLLVPSPLGKKYVYDVGYVIRLVRAFLSENSSFLSMNRIHRIASLMDSYMAEVCVDFGLYPSKFVKLLEALPEFARQSHNRLYRAIDMYLEIHTKLSEEVKMRICSTLNFKKLSTDVLKHAVHNSNLPSKIAVIIFMNQQFKLKSLLLKKHHFVTPGGEKNHHDADIEKTLLCSKNHNVSTRNHRFEAHQWRSGMQIKVMKRENNFCRVMQSEKSSGYLPRLCS